MITFRNRIWYSAKPMTLTPPRPVLQPTKKKINKDLLISIFDGVESSLGNYANFILQLLSSCYKKDF